MNRISFQVFILQAVFIFLNMEISYAQQQTSDQLSLSIGASVGYAPILTFGDVDDSGAIIGLSGDLQYQNIIGQLDFVYVISETLSSESFSSGMGFLVRLVILLLLPMKFTFPSC